MRKAAAIITFGLAVVMAATTAQAQRRQEKLYQDLDRSMQEQQRRQQNNQQNQFEFNQLRQSIDRNNLFTPAPVIPGPGFNPR